MTEAKNAQVDSLLGQIQGLQGTIASLEDAVKRLGVDNAALRKLVFASLRPSASGFDTLAPGQGYLFGDPVDAAESTPEEADPEKPPKNGRKKKRPTGRQPLPPELERVEDKLPVDEEDRLCSCCSPARECRIIRYEETEILEYSPARLFVRVIMRPVSACSSGMGGVAISPLPLRIIEKGRPGVSLLTFVILSKYVDHLTLYRIAKILKRHNVRVPESTLCDWVGAVADALAPIVVAMKQWMLKQPYVQADETPAKARDPGRKKGSKHKQVYFFACSIPWKDVIFEYHTDRRGDSLSSFLDGFGGEVIQVDEYAGYDGFFRENPGVVRAGCWSHSVRKFKAALKECDRVALARPVCHIVKVLEGLENRMREKGRSPVERLAVRQRIHAPALTKIRKTLDEGLADPTIEPKSTYGQAIRYAHNHWKRLTAFLVDGRVEMSNNGIESSIRPLAIGRKNWMHIGHIDAGDRAATMYSLLLTCARLGIDPQAYLHDVLERIPTHPIDQIHDLIPRNWRPLPAKSEPEPQEQPSE